MPNCKEHKDCDLVCGCRDGYYCAGESHRAVWMHVPRKKEYRYRPVHEMRALGLLPDDMPDDAEQYYNTRAEEMP